MAWKGRFFMKYSIIVGLLVALAAVAGCEDDPNTGSGGSDTGGSAGEGGSAGSGGHGTAGHGGGTAGSGGGTGGSGGSAQACDNPKVVDNVDPAVRCKTGVPTDVVSVVMAPANTVWADKVEDFSSEYGPENYGSKQALQAPNVYPTSGDEPKAWAQSAEDAANEFIEVGFSTPVVAESVWVFETFNPGAISKITVKAADGPHVVYQASPMQGGFGMCAHVLSVSTKTCSPISAVRIDVASDKVSTFNEIDAVGLIPAP